MSKDQLSQALQRVQIANCYQRLIENANDQILNFSDDSPYAQTVVQEVMEFAERRLAELVGIVSESKTSASSSFSEEDVVILKKLVEIAKKKPPTRSVVETKEELIERVVEPVKVTKQPKTIKPPKAKVAKAPKENEEAPVVNPSTPNQGATAAPAPPPPGVRPMPIGAEFEAVSQQHALESAAAIQNNPLLRTLLSS